MQTKDDSKYIDEIESFKKIDEMPKEQIEKILAKIDDEINQEGYNNEL